MARLTSQEIASLVGQLVQWQTPDAMAGLENGANERLGSDDFFNQGGLAFLRNAWIAAKFAQTRQAEQVRLIADIWPDFELQKNGQNELFEATEADDPERRRGDEYRTATGQIVHDPVENWIVRAEQASAWLEAACQKKFNKRYAARVNLVVYLNLSEFGIRQNEIENCFVPATKAVKDSFDDIWVLWKERAYLVWKSGEVH